ncbi:MAG: hypothetical protein AB1810_01915 [Pseudomonadota bacterium]
MKSLILTLLILALGASTAWAADNAEEFRTIDNKVQDLKRAAIELGKEISILEEELLFPASTEYALYLSTQTDESFKLVTVIVKLDGQVVTNHMYDVSELTALENGAVQELHKGNVKTGKHSIEVTFMSRVGKNIRRHTKSHEFTKEDKPVYIEMALNAKQAGGAGEPVITVKQWN